ncbi:MAG TPA: hypothetical protein VK563_19115 [Puia sp.]|nr:hypothetical protein [Puia sp.]
MRYTFLFIIMLLSFCSGSAQTFLTGKIHKKESTEILVSVSIQNHTQRKYDLSDEGGNYRIPAREGDQLTFSSVGFLTDTVIVTETMLSGDCPISLETRVVALPSFQVGSLSNYQLDSMARREEYKWIYEHGNVQRVEKERHGDGVGMNIDLFRNASKGDKDREKLKKRLLKEEEQHYIDYRYNREYISRLTHLKGDSLQKFMEYYRPTYDYTRKAATVDILIFINDSFKKFKTLPFPKDAAARDSVGSGPVNAAGKP